MTQILDFYYWHFPTCCGNTSIGRNTILGQTYSIASNYVLNMQFGILMREWFIIVCRYYYMLMLCYFIYVLLSSSWQCNCLLSFYTIQHFKYYNRKLLLMKYTIQAKKSVATYIRVIKWGSQYIDLSFEFH